MDPWRQTVETRLGELRADIRTITADLASLKATVAAMQVTIAQLPTKAFIVHALIGGMGVFGAFQVFAGGPLS